MLFRLVVRGEWKDILLLGRWLHSSALVGCPLLFKGWPPDHWLVANGGRHASKTSNVFSRSSVQDISHEIRRWAPTILAAAADNEAREGERMALESVLERLENWSDALLTEADYFCPGGG